jgi:hypothetical protein
MSAIGEARSFRKAARELREQAELETDPDKKAELEKQAKDYEDDVSFAWSIAREE